jgi:hypothetical protein
MFKLSRLFIRLLNSDQGQQGGGGGGAAGGSTQGGGGAAPWYQGVAGIDSELIGHFVNKGWDKLTAAEAAAHAAKAHRDAEKFVGAPANELMRLPKDASDEAGWKNIWKKLGTPDKSDDYDFSGIKRSDGTALDDAFAKQMKDEAFKLNLPKDTAAKMTEQFVKYQDNVRAAESAEQAAKLTEERQALQKNWGANFEANKFTAQRAAQALGVDPETVGLLEKHVGYSKVMDMFLNIGSKIGEDKFVSSGGNSSNGVMTRDQAIARKGELMADKAWTKSYLDGDAAKKREMLALNTLIVGTQ